MAIRTLCITDDADRPTVASFIGMHQTGIEVTVIAGAIEQLYRDPELRRRMGEAARQRIATNFRNEDTVRKTIALYQELVPNPD